MAAERRRTDIGFAGGQVLAVRLEQSAYEELHKALGGDGWHELKTEDSDIAIDLKQIVYVRVDTEQHRVGF
jgi:hypothetical protein